MDLQSTNSVEENSIKDLAPPAAKKQRTENDVISTDCGSRSQSPGVPRGRKHQTPLFYLSKVRSISQCFNNPSSAVGIKGLSVSNGYCEY